MYKISADPHPRWLNSGGPEILHIPYFNGFAYIYLLIWAPPNSLGRGKNHQKSGLPRIKKTTRGCCIAPSNNYNKIVHMYKISADPHPRWLNSGVQRSYTYRTVLFVIQFLEEKSAPGAQKATPNRCFLSHFSRKRRWRRKIRQKWVSGGQKPTPKRSILPHTYPK